MASVTVRTKPITREKLAKFFPDNHELVRLLETLAQDVIVNIPASINPSLIVVDDVQQTAELACAIANAARAIAAQALVLAAQANEGPPPTAAIPAAAINDGPPPAPAPLPDAINDGPPTMPQVLPDIPDDLQAQVSALRARLDAAERTIANYKEGPTP